MQIVRDEGMMLGDFVASQEAIDARLSAAEVAALRLYTGSAFQPGFGRIRLSESGKST